MRPNPVRRALKAGHTVVGSELSRLRSPDVARLYALAGFDFVFIDMEHSAFTLETVADMIATARAAGIVPIVRIPQAEYPFACRVLDQGAQGIIVPRVNTPEQVGDIVSWMRYPPHGIRGYASTSAQTDFATVTPEAFIEANNRETLCVIQIERRKRSTTWTKCSRFRASTWLAWGTWTCRSILASPVSSSTRKWSQLSNGSSRPQTVTELPPELSDRKSSRLSTGCKRGYVSFRIRQKRCFCRRPRPRPYGDSNRPPCSGCSNRSEYVEPVGSLRAALETLRAGQS